MSTKRLKGPNRPIKSQEERAYILENLSFVDEVIVFDEDTPLDLIERIRPDVLVKGGDYDEDTIVGASYVKGYGGIVEIIEYLKNHSTTETLKVIRERA